MDIQLTSDGLREWTTQRAWRATRPATELGLTHDMSSSFPKLDRFKNGHSLCEAQPQMLLPPSGVWVVHLSPHLKANSLPAKRLLSQKFTLHHLDLGISEWPSPRWPWSMRESQPFLAVHETLVIGLSIQLLLLESQCSRRSSDASENNDNKLIRCRCMFCVGAALHNLPQLHPLLL